MDDIIEAAWMIHDDGFIAVDTGPLSAQVSGLHIKGEKLSKPTINEVDEIRFIIGGTHERCH